MHRGASTSVSLIREVSAKDAGAGTQERGSRKGVASSLLLFALGAAVIVAAFFFIMSCCTGQYHIIEITH